MNRIKLTQRWMQVVALASVMALLLAACGPEAAPTPTAVTTNDTPAPAQATEAGGTQPGTAAQEKPTVYFATFAIPNAFWGLMERGAKDAAEQVGVDVVWTQGQEFSTEQTIERMNTGIAAKPQYMVVTDVDPNAMNPVIEKAKEAGIYVININAEDPSANPPYEFYVGANEEQNGRAAAQATLDDSRDTPKRAACAIHVQGHAGLEARCKGYTDVLEEAGVTVDKIDVAGGPTDAEEKTRAYFTANSDAGAIYTLTAGPEAFDPVLKVLQDDNLAEKVIFVTNDTSQTAFDAIKAGDLTAAIDQQPYLQGYLPVIWAALHAKGAFAPANDTYTGPFLIKQDNVEQIEKLIADKLR